MIKRPPVVLPGEADPRIQKSARVCGAIGFFAFAIVPPRSFVAVSGDLIQLILLFGAVLVPIWLLLTSIDASGEGQINKEGTERINAAFEKMQSKLVSLFAIYCGTIIFLIFSKMICIWCEPHMATRVSAMLAARASAAFSGLLVGDAYARTQATITIQGHVQFFRGMVSSLRHIAKPSV